MIKRRDEEGFNLAFLDVMACGLGAIILIFMLVKFNAPSQEPTEERQRLKQALAQLTDEQVSLQASLSQANGQKEALQQSNKQLFGALDLLNKSNKETASAQSKQIAVVANLEHAIAAAAPLHRDDKVKLSGIGEEQYLLGLKVQGRQIGVLLDHSASMTNELLMDIISSKVASRRQRKAAKKWRRTKRIALWLLDRVPDNSRVTMVSYNETANLVGSSKSVLGKDKEGLTKMANVIDTLMPENGTNLQIALKKIKQLNPNIDSLYVITDGLPTLGDKGTGLQQFSNCRSFFSKVFTITGKCRRLLFNHTVEHAGLDGVKVNVILLPLEGDPGAADAYWQWTASTGGLLISPERSWP